ncbi:MAG: DUF72 domain-containing protein [Euryarchaeota archaeon]|nr:DUF72 domain-containing protein [Euryarchaeota archaeon]MDE1836332.1 DUF72 domain-containing protein [Euryarchaeota archaeon]MDE1879130.1 DUF72 domain-containing protein [Euryarchaeota archaeon]MDE2044272.1 DUF72 domain-containing protein [Thermoplasmata archaeon]
MADLRIGCSSWTSEAWWGRVYPKTLKDSERLAWYARSFDSVEVDSSYYRPPPRGMIEGWRSRTPPAFRFTLKLTRDFLDPKVPLDRDRLGAFLGTARVLGEKLGPILLQFTPWVRPGKARDHVVALMDALDGDLRYALELRDRAWFEGDQLAWLLGELSRRQIALVWSYLTYVEVPPKVTTDFLYLRFIGDHTTVPEEVHGEVRVDRTPVVRLWSDRLRAEAQRVERAFVFFNNHFAGFAPESVNLFRREMGLEPLNYGPGTFQQRLP